MPTTINDFTIEPRTTAPEPAAVAVPRAEKPAAEIEREIERTTRGERERAMRSWAY